MTGSDDSADADDGDDVRFEDAIAAIRSAIDADPDEPIVVRTPQFERQDGVDPAEPPVTERGFDGLRDLSDSELKALGLRPWSKDNDLFLFPAEWYPHIPEGYPVVDIFGDQEAFDPDGTHTNDRRMGVLPYGIVPEDGDPPEEGERPIERAD